MRKNNTLFFILTLICMLLVNTQLIAQNKKEITIESIFKENTFKINTVPGFNTLKDGKTYTQIDEETRLLNGEESQAQFLQSINQYNLKNGKKMNTIFSKPDSLSKIVRYTFSEDESKILFFTDIEPIYRRSANFKTWLYDLKTKKITLIHKNKIMHATFNPQGTEIAYVLNNNIFTYNISTEKTIQITDDGEKNKIINGNCDWVYEEEFAFSKAFEWSPNGKYLAYYKFDESNVKEFTLQFYNDSSNYVENYTYKYPKAGEDNSIVSIHIYNVQNSVTNLVQIGKEKDQYIPRIKWAKNGSNLCVYRLNRLQNHLELLLENADNCETQVIYSEKSPYYIDINDNLVFLSDGKSFIFNSEKDGFNHLYVWDWENQKEKQLTSGKWDVDALIGVDESKNMVYFTAGISSPMERKLYSYHLKSGVTTLLTPEEGTHAITPCIGYQYFLDRFSSINNVPVFRLLNSKGQVVRILEDNSHLKSVMQEYTFSDIEFLQIPNENNELLNAWMIKPKDFDSRKKYPVLLYQYSGPGSQQVVDAFPVGNYFWHQLLAQKGYIVVCVDGRGTGARGREFKNVTYLNLGKYESDDQIAVGKFMAQQNFVDKNRIGIWGWSYGGFMSSICLFKGADVFKAAIAVAPVTNWRFYDNIYTERYMRQPHENPKGYDENAPEKMAHLLKGKFLMIHGLTDDNVHFQNAAVLTKELIKANKQFESEYYPNKNHSIYGGNTREQLFKRMTNFLIENL